MDLVIRGATVYDGTGAAPTITDVGITGARIERVGDLRVAPPARVADAAGLALAPGFIDVHTHDDFAVFQIPLMDFKVGQGVTTTVVGNCGLGAAPFEHVRSSLVTFGVDPARTSLPSWETYGEYLDAVDANPPSVNVAVLVGHGTVRLDAMGRERRAPTEAELARMLDTLAAGLDAGCVGYSTGLIYEPGRHADTDELIALAADMARVGGVYATHMRNESTGLLDAVREAIRVGEEGGVPVQISHHKASSPPAWGLVQQSLALIDAARARGVAVTADQYPYTAGSTILAAVLQNLDEGTAGFGAVPWENHLLASTPGQPEWEGQTLTDLAASFDVEPLEAARRVVDAEGEAAVVIVESMCEDDVRAVMAHPTTMIGSDGIPTPAGKPHPRLYGTFARVLGHYARDLGVLPLTEAVHRMTGLPAATFGLPGRGVIEPGAAADLVLFDPDVIDDVATYADPRRHPAGVAGVWVNGTEVVHDGVHTGARPGQALRRG